MATPFLLFLGDIGASELLLILAVVLVFFGAKRIPELARGLGTGIREFKSATQEIRTNIEQADRPAPHPVAPAASVPYPGYPHPSYFAPVEQPPVPAAV